jgi:CHAD domain-containing protein
MPERIAATPTDTNADGLVIDLRPQVAAARSNEPGRTVELLVSIDLDNPDRAAIVLSPDSGTPSGRVRKPRHRLELGIEEPLAIGLQRVCLAEFDEIVYNLRHEADAVRGVHSARKAMKRIRGMLRLVRDEIGYDIYRAENVVLRDAARRLSPVRTAQVMRNLAEAQLEAHRAVIDPVAAEHLLDVLDARCADIADDVLGDRQLRVDVVTTMLCARARFASWPLVDTNLDGLGVPRHRIPDDFSSIGPGIDRVYRRGRRAMRAAVEAPSAGTFHAWRKRVKYLRYQMESLHLIWPDVVGGTAAALAELAESLGEEHDLAEFAGLIATHTSLLPDDQGRRRLLVGIARRRLDLQRHALRLGTRLYQERPRSYVARLGAYWESGRQA